MSQTKAQLIQPIGVVTASNVVVSGVMTASSFDGRVVGSAASIIQGKNLNVGAFNASSFAGDFTGNATGIITSSAIKVGQLTASSFVGDFTGTATSMFKGTGFTAGTVNAQGFVADVTGNVTGDVTGNIAGDVTGNVTGSASGHAGGLGVNYNGGWTGAGTSQINAGVVTATYYYGDGSNLDGVSSGPVSQQAVTIDGASTSIDLSNGNLIYASQSANTTVSFANSENGNVYFVRVKDATDTARTITWPDRITWEGGTTPTLLNANDTGEAQILLLVTRDMGVTWYGKEIYSNAGGKELWSWGYNRYGQLGQNGSYPSDQSSPVQIDGGWKTVCSGKEVTFSTKNDGTLWGWGLDHRGQLGQNNITPDNAGYSSPVQIPGTTWNTVSTAWSNALASKTDGTLWAWGDAWGGGLGQNDGDRRSSPAQIPGTTWNEITRAAYSSFATKTDGTLWSWGNNQKGDLGQNDRTSLSSPTQIGTETTWSKLSGGHNNIFATKTDGTLWAWGDNFHGALGVNQAAANLTATSSPTQIGTDTTWANISSSNYGGCATKTDGTLWLWGVNGHGRLAQNNDWPGLNALSSPVQIPGTTWTSVTGLNYVTAAMKTDNTLWVWGYNNKGQLGQNNVVSYSSPVQVPGTDYVTTHGRWTADGSRAAHLSALKNP